MMHRQRGVNMLIVDDSPIDMEVLKDDLFKNNKLKNDFTVEHTVKGAKNFILANKVDLIFLDLNMPDESPLELLEFVKTSPLLQHIFVIVATASSDPRDWNMAHDKGADCYIVKPLNIDKMREAVAGVPQLGWMVTMESELAVAA